MKYRYKVTKENYLDMLKSQMKQKQRSFPNLFFAFLFTFGQMGILAIYTVFSNPDPELLSWAWPLSITTFLLQAAYQLSFGIQAKSTLKLMIRKGQITDDYWKEHCLEQKDTSLSLRFGSRSGVFDCLQYAGSAEEGTVLLLHFNTIGRRQAVERVIVPLTVFKNEAEKAAFLSSLKQTSLQIFKMEEEISSIPDEYGFCFSYDYDLKTYFRDQRQAFRLMYLTPLVWTPPAFIKLGITAYLIYLAIAGNYSIGIETLIIIACIMLNFKHIIMLTPLINLTLRSSLTPMLAEYINQHTDTYITKEKLIVHNKVLYSEVPFSDIRHVRRLPNAIAVYLPKDAILTIPTTNVDARTVEMAIHLISG
jgi:hypothetical protein